MNGGRGVIDRVMRQDKKVRDGQLTFILARGIGDAFITREVARDDVRRCRRKPPPGLLDAVAALRTDAVDAFVDVVALVLAVADVACSGDAGLARLAPPSGLAPVPSMDRLLLGATRVDDGVGIAVAPSSSSLRNNNYDSAVNIIWNSRDDTFMRWERNVG